jgi:hypothetical protein
MQILDIVSELLGGDTPEQHASPREKKQQRG